MQRNYYGSKYKNKKVTNDYGTFDSQKEALRAYKLKRMESEGEITNLKMQVPFELIPQQKLKEPRPTIDEHGRPTGTMQRTETAVKYIADFVYTDKDGHIVVEDTKSPITRTTEYRIKRKLMKWIHGIEIHEV